jgi:hypothetical protein
MIAEDQCPIALSMSKKRSKMEVQVERFEDADDQHIDETRDWYYSGTTYIYQEQGRIYKARRYNDTPMEASIFYFESKNLVDGIPYADLLFFKVVNHLVREIGVSKIRILTATMENGYTDVDISRVLLASAG